MTNTASIKGYKPTFEIKGYENITDLSELYEYGNELSKQIRSWNGENVYELKKMLVSAWEIAKIYNLKIPGFNAGPEVVGIYQKDIPKGYLRRDDIENAIAQDIKGNILIGFEKLFVKTH